MILTIKDATSVLKDSVSLLVFFITTPIIGYCKAWVARQFGDDLPESLGFLTLNPIVHINLIWTALFLMYDLLINQISFACCIGMWRYIPLNHSNYKGRFGSLKLFLTYFVDSIVAVFLAFISLMILIVWLRVDPLIIYLNLSFKFLSSYSSLSIIFIFMLATSVIVNVTRAALSIFLNIFLWIFQSLMSDNEKIYQQMSFIIILLFFLMIVVFAGYAEALLFSLIAQIGRYCGHMIGVL